MLRRFLNAFFHPLTETEMIFFLSKRVAAIFRIFVNKKDKIFKIKTKKSETNVSDYKRRQTF